MIQKALGLTCLATVAALTPALALDTELQLGPDEMRINLTLENQQWSNGAMIHDGAVGRTSMDVRWYDVGIHLDGVLVLDGQSSSTITDFETTEITAKIDYLFEIIDIAQIIPWVEVSSYPYDTGSFRYIWAGLDFWYLTPLQGLEAGASLQYNLADATPKSKRAYGEHHVVSTVGARYLYQAAPLDTMAFGLIDIASRSYALHNTGVSNQGLYTFRLGGQVTLPMPWEELWLVGKAQNIWYLDSDIRDSLALAGRDRSELVFSIGLEWAAE